jgi:hypothetical protein
MSKPNKPTELRDRHFERQVEQIELHIDRVFEPVSPVVLAMRRLRDLIANDVPPRRRPNDAA